MKFSHLAVSVIAALPLISCGRSSGVMDSAPVSLVRPGAVVSLSIDSTFEASFPEVLNDFQLQILDDTLLVVQAQTSGSDICHFKVYSTTDFRYLGEFARNGRGPGEMLAPHVVKSGPGENSLNINFNAVGKACAIDVVETLASGSPVVSQDYILPPGSIDWVPLADSMQFLLRSQEGKVGFEVYGNGGKLLKSFDFDEKASGDDLLTHLSGILVKHESAPCVAEVMSFFPLVNIFDVGSGKVRSVAVNGSYRKWESVVGGMIGMDTMEYYTGATSSADYIFAVYKGLPLKDLMQGGSGSSVHVFDWDGGFLYDIRVPEDIGSITFDGLAGCLYCIDKSEGRIVCYRLPDLLK